MQKKKKRVNFPQSSTRLAFSAFAETVALSVLRPTSPVFAATSVCFEEPRLLSVHHEDCNLLRVWTRKKGLAAPVIQGLEK